MESEITSLELANQQLELKSKEREGSTAPVIGASDVYAAEKNQLLRNFKNSLNKVDALAAMVCYIVLRNVCCRFFKTFNLIFIAFVLTDSNSGRVYF